MQFETAKDNPLVISCRIFINDLIAVTKQLQSFIIYLFNVFITVIVSSIRYLSFDYLLAASNSFIYSTNVCTPSTGIAL